MMCWYKYRDLKLYLNLSLSHSLLKLTILSLFLPILCFIAYLFLSHWMSNNNLEIYTMVIFIYNIQNTIYSL